MCSQRLLAKLSRVGLLLSLPAMAGCWNIATPVTPTSGGDGGTGGDYKTFFIAEQVTYENATAPCYTANNVQVLGVELRKLLIARQWTGMLADENCGGAKCAKPSDFVEASVAGPGGLVGRDDVWADNSTLAVFAGHGAQNHLIFRQSEPTPSGPPVCQVNFARVENNQVKQETALGALAGRKTRVAMFLASCIGYMSESGAAGEVNEADFFNGLGRNSSWEYLAFFDPANISTVQVNKFIGCVGGTFAAYDRYCWMDTMWYYSPQVRSQPMFFTTGRGHETLTTIGKRHEESNFLSGAHLPVLPSAQFNPSVDNMYWTGVWNDGIYGNEDPEPSDCQHLL